MQLLQARSEIDCPQAQSEKGRLSATIPTSVYQTHRSELTSDGWRKKGLRPLVSDARTKHAFRMVQWCRERYKRALHHDFDQAKRRPQDASAAVVTIDSGVASLGTPTWREEGAINRVRRFGGQAVPAARPWVQSYYKRSKS